MAEVFKIDLAYPRTLAMKSSKKFGEYTSRIYNHLGMK